MDTFFHYTIRVVWSYSRKYHLHTLRAVRSFGGHHYASLFGIELGMVHGGYADDYRVQLPTSKVCEPERFKSLAGAKHYLETLLGLSEPRKVVQS